MTLGLKPGIELVRDWKGRRHIVRVREDGFAYDGRRFETLSEVARAITGTRWSGPRFFGLKDAKSRSGRKSSPKRAEASQSIAEAEAKAAEASKAAEAKRAELEARIAAMKQSVRSVG